MSVPGTQDQPRRDSARIEADRLRRQLEAAARNNRRMVELLEATRQEITELKQALETATTPPFTVATLLAVHAPRAARTGVEAEAVARGGADVVQNGRRLRVGISPLVDPASLRPGDEVLMDESSLVVGTAGPMTAGPLARVRERREDGRLVVDLGGDTERVVACGPDLEAVTLGRADAVRLDSRQEWAVERVELSDVDDVLLEQVPDVTYADIGGLGAQIAQIREAVEIPFLHPELYRQHGLRAPKGILLYGPPGTGKTMLAKAVAQSLSQHRQGGRPPLFLNIKGPELLNKYVGETERQIRLIFERARAQADSGTPVVVFFDEMEALFRTRGSGVSSDVETTIVPQLLAEIDGVESLENVIVIGASNREDMIDPAVLRPGRLDVKIRVARPDRDGAAQIMGTHLSDQVPVHPDEVAHAGSRQAARTRMIERTVDALYARDRAAALGQLTDVTGAEHIVHLSDLVSGAVVADVVDRAKRHAVRDLIDADGAEAARGVRTEHLLAAVAAVQDDQRDMLAAVSVDQWAQTAGWRGPRLTSLRVLGEQEAGR